MSAYAFAGFFLAAIALAALIPSWLDRRRAARRLAAAELAVMSPLEARLIERMNVALAGDDVTRIEYHYLDGEVSA